MTSPPDHDLAPLFLPGDSDPRALPGDSDPRADSHDMIIGVTKKFFRNATDSEYDYVGYTYKHMSVLRSGQVTFYETFSNHPIKVSVKLTADAV